MYIMHDACSNSSLNTCRANLGKHDAMLGRAANTEANLPAFATPCLGLATVHCGPTSHQPNPCGSGVV